MLRLAIVRECSLFSRRAFRYDGGNNSRQLLARTRQYVFPQDRHRVYSFARARWAALVIRPFAEVLTHFAHARRLMLLTRWQYGHGQW